MLPYRRRSIIFCILILLIIIQPIIYRFYPVNIECDKNTNEITFPENFTDRASIFNLNPKILCWIPTTLKRLDRARVVYQTWAKRCDLVLFIVAGQIPAPPPDRSIYPFSIVYVGDEQIEKYRKLPEKVLLALKHIYEKYINEYDWFFKADDDTYVIMENLRHFLRRHPSNYSFCYGYIAKTPDRFYPSGGAGYVLSRGALLQFGQQILSQPDKLELCHKDEAEDINLAYCLARAGVYVTNARDDHQLERFHPMTFEQHYLGKFTKWIERNAQFDQKKGDECCSPLTISFHSLGPDEMKMIHFLLYHIQKAPI